MLRWLLAGVLILAAGSTACRDGGGATAGPATQPAATHTAIVEPTQNIQPSATPDTTTTIVLDPGHGGDEVGAAEFGVVEKASNLDFAFRIERILVAQGYEVILTRRQDQRVGSAPGLGAGFGATRFDLQARVDTANEAGGEVFIAIHSNGSPSGSESGVEVWYDPQRAFGAENLRLAQLLQDRVLASLGEFGYAARDRGLKDDTCFRNRDGRCFPLFVLGPERVVRRDELVRRGLDPEDFGFEDGVQERTTRATQMPGALVELLFVTNASDAAVLADDAAREAIARGVAAAIVEFVGPPIRGG